MKTITKIASVLIPTLTLSMSVTAHDPKLHAIKTAKADCSKIDHSKLDMKDPVAIAMMKKCMKQAEKSKKGMDHSKMDMSKMEHKNMKKAVLKENKKHDHKEHNH